MTLDREDPRLLAHALGELDAADREVVEDALAGNVELRAEAAALGGVAAALGNAYRAEDGVLLDGQRRRTIDRASRPASTSRWRYWVTGLGGAGAVAAILVMVVASQTRYIKKSRSAPRQIHKAYLIDPDTSAAAPAGSPRPDKTRDPLDSLLGGATAYPKTRSALGRLYDGTAPSKKNASDNPLFGLKGPAVELPGVETYRRIRDNEFLAVAQHPLSTFSIDVDTASYSNVRRFIERGALPPPDAVRIEELLNHFPYAYAPPRDGQPFAAHVEVANAPWAPQHRLVRVALKGREIAADQRPPSNLVFLIDVSGSMQPPNRLPLLKQALGMMVGKLGDRDRVAMVVYAGSSGLVLPSTSCADKRPIFDALARLDAGGSTNGGEGIALAYHVARGAFVAGGTNRVILATDGDFNVGITEDEDLTRLIKNEAQTGVFLTVLGVGMGNIKDATLERLADRGNGHYAYLDSIEEAHKVLIEEMGGTLVTIAKDVKIQIEWNPEAVASYRLIGYENRLLADRNFDDDKKDAGEIGAGHAVTAFYEVVPAAGAPAAGDLMTLRLRHKQPDGDMSRPETVQVRDGGARFEQASTDFRFAAGVAAFGMVLRDSPHKGSATFEKAEDIARASLGPDDAGYRRQFVSLVARARGLRRP